MFIHEDLNVFYGAYVFDLYLCNIAFHLIVATESCLLNFSHLLDQFLSFLKPHIIVLPSLPPKNQTSFSPDDLPTQSRLCL